MGPQARDSFRLPDECPRCGYTILSWRYLSSDGLWYARCLRCLFTALPHSAPPKRRWSLGDPDLEEDATSKRFALLEVD